MPFAQFTFPGVEHALGLTLTEADLFPEVRPAELSADFVERMRGDIALALAVNTEKARSEFIIAPILSELRRMLKGGFGLFSGVEFEVDLARGLNGFCDFILTRSPFQSALTAPAVTIVEAKNDNLRGGLGQCIGAMVAAREFNLQSVPPVGAVYGVVTTGGAWKFLRLVGAAVTLDAGEYFASELPRIMGIFVHILRPDGSTRR